MTTNRLTGAVRALRDRPMILGAAATLSSRLFGKLASAVFIFVLAAHVPRSDYVTYSYLVALALLFAALADTGVAVVAAREVARQDLTPAEAMRASLLPICVGGALGFALVIVFGLLDSGPGSTGWPLVLTAAFVLVNAFFNLQADVLRASGRLGLEAGLQLGGGLLFIGVGTLVAIVLDLGVTALMGAFLLKEVSVVLVAQCFLPLPTAGRTRPGLVRQLWKLGIVVAFAGILLAVAMRMSQIVVQNFASEREQADYASAYRFADIAFIASQSLGFALLPYLSARFGANREHGFALGRRMLIATVSIALILTPIFVLLAPVAVNVLFPKYPGAASSAQILVAGFPLLVMYVVCMVGLLADRRERSVVIANVSAVVAAGIGAIFIAESPRPEVAALSAVATYATLAVVALVLFFRRGMRQSAAPVGAE